MTDGSAPGSTSVIAAIFQFSEGRFLFRVTGVSQLATAVACVSVGLGLPPGHPEGQAELQHLFSCHPNQLFYPCSLILLWIVC